MPARDDIIRRVAAAALLAVLAASSALLSAGCSGGPRYSRAGLAEASDGDTIAVLPLVNYTREENAPDVVRDALVVELLDAGKFAVIDPGEVETVVLEQRLRLTDRLSAEALRALGERLGAGLVMVGAVNEFEMINEGNNVVPSVSISLRIIECASGRMLWAATHSKRGDDGETVFGMGRIDSLEKLASVAAKEIAASLKPSKK